MANTVIQIKRSTTTTAPTPGSLTAAEPAYSYSSGKLFLGSSDGTQVIEIGGQAYINVAVSAYNFANVANDRAVAAYTAANNAISSSAGPAFDKANSANIIASQAFDKANSANLLAFNTGIGANAFAAATIAGANAAVGAGANAFASATIAGANSAVGAGANAFASATIAGANTAVGAGANNFLLTVIAGANTAVGTGANNFMIAVSNGANTAVGGGANAFAAATIAGANTAIGAGANAYSNTTFVKLVAPNQTITGNLAISGSLIISGNTFKIDANTLVVQDPLITLAGNNNTSDIADIGFIGLYNNATSINVYTGLVRDATVKEYYLFDRYSAVPQFNDIDPNGNNFTLAVLNSAIRTSNLNLGGTNAIVWLTSAFAAANAANLVLTANVNYVNTAMQSAFLVANSAVVNASAAFAASNNVSGNVTAAFLVANSAVTNAAAAFAKANTANINAANGSFISTGIISVLYGGTGQTSFTNNGILFGNTSGNIRVTAAGTEGNLLQVNLQGIPTFGMLDGGTF